MCVDITCPDPGLQMGRQAQRLCPHMLGVWVLLAVWVTPAPRPLPAPCPHPSLGRGLSSSSPRSYPRRSSVARLNWSLCSAGLSLSLWEARASGSWAPEATAVCVRFWVFALLGPAVLAQHFFLNQLKAS